MVQLEYPIPKGDRGPGYWSRLGNIWKSRRKFLRPDHSIDWRDSFETTEQRTGSRAVPLSNLLRKPIKKGFKFAILGDTGEGDRSQYALLPLLRALDLDFLIIDGDVAYPAGSTEDFNDGLFRPYSLLGIPVWAVPGNHEYYSPHNGREFYDLFCTPNSAAVWESFGVPFVQQPGTYWELSEADQRLVVIGLDSLKAGNLDGHGGHRADSRQLEWLTWRLETAQRRPKPDKGEIAVIVLFHIPSLVSGKRQGDVYLDRLHRIIGSYPCIKLVICGHIHNLQIYDPRTFGEFLKTCGSTSNPSHGAPIYYVSGGGGAYLTSTTFSKGPFDPTTRYPTEEQWREFVPIGRRALAKLGIERWSIGRVLSLFSEDMRADGDVGDFQSFLLVEVDKSGSIQVCPVFLDDPASLYPHLADHVIVDVLRGNYKPDPEMVEKCIQRELCVKL